MYETDYEPTRCRRLNINICVEEMLPYMIIFQTFKILLIFNCVLTDNEKKTMRRLVEYITLWNYLVFVFTGKVTILDS